MPKAGTYFSESGFAFAFTENLLNSGLLSGSAAPRFLSTYAEGKGQHWDAHIPARPVAFYFQFKIPDVLQRGRTLTTGARLKLPFYRMNLRSENGYAQHHGLLDMEARGENVYYVAPRFHDSAMLDSLFSKREIPSHSAWFRPSNVTPPDYIKSHGAVYDDRGHLWEIRSRSRSLHYGPLGPDNFLIKWRESVENASRISPVTFLDHLIANIDAAVNAARRGQLTVEEENQKLRETNEPSEEHVRLSVEAIDEAWTSRLTPIEHKGNPLIEAVLKARAQLGLEILIGGNNEH